MAVSSSSNSSAGANDSSSIMADAVRAGDDAIILTPAVTAAAAASDPAAASAPVVSAGLLVATQPDPVPEHTSACYKALTTPEVIESIFSQLGDPISDPEISRTLAGCTQCCRAFLEPAIDMLWATMDSIHPFIALVPSISKSDDAYYALGRVVPDTMKRFRYYAKRLRTFIERESSYEYHISVTMRLLESRSASSSEPPLFPSLKSMTWSSTRPELLLFMSSDLDALHINCSSGSGGSHALVFLHGLVDQSRRLSTLSISELIPRKSLELLFKFHGLRTLNISDAIVLSIEKGDLGSLSQLKELTELHISLDAFSGDLNAHPHTLSFAPNLRTLELSGPLSVLSSMIQTVPSTCELHTVKLSLTETHEVTITEYKEWLRALNTLLDLLSTSFEPTLRHLTIFDHRSRAHDMGSEFNDDAMHIFACLLSLPQLAQLELTIAGRISLSNNDLERMATAWPELRTLRLSWDTGNQRPNLSSLQVFARHCPKLRHLEYALETRNLPAELGDDVVSVHPLEIFGVLWSSADSDLHATARHLDLLFPQLKEIPYRSDSDWGRIQGMLLSFQKIRRDHDRRRLVTFGPGQVYHTT